MSRKGGYFWCRRCRRRCCGRKLFATSGKIAEPSSIPFKTSTLICVGSIIVTLAEFAAFVIDTVVNVNGAIQSFPTTVTGAFIIGSYVRAFPIRTWVWAAMICRIWRRINTSRADHSLQTFDRHFFRIKPLVKYQVFAIIVTPTNFVDLRLY